jgi:octaprenyl-diphosphate synthase
VPDSQNDPILQIANKLQPELKKVDEIIINNSQGKSELIMEIASHLVLSGGKRIRPILTILSAKLCGYNQGSRHCELAAAVELIHTATLLHDDVVDNSNLRRGKKTSNAIWGNKASILVGDYLLSAAFQLMVGDGSIEVLDILSNTSKVMADGEVLQLTNSNDVEIREEKYLEIISAKTAILFSAATRIGAVITESEANKQAALKNFGNNLGVAFQIMDDVLDYSAQTAILGKDIGDDFYEGKVTMPIILAFARANEEEKKRLKKIFAENLMAEQRNEEYFAEIIALINKYDVLDAVFAKAKSYEAAAIKDLEIFPDCAEKNMLLTILNYCLGRKY